MRYIQGEETIVCVDTLGALIMPRCINWASQHGQKTRNNFLADHFLFFWGIIGDQASWVCVFLGSCLTAIVQCVMAAGALVHRTPWSIGRASKGARSQFVGVLIFCR